MIIAVASDGLQIAPHFSQCQNFNYYTTQSYEISGSQNLPAQGCTDTEYASLMSMMGINAIICNMVGLATKSAFEEQGIEVVTGVTGTALDAARAYVDRKAQELLDEDDFDDDDDDDDDDGDGGDGDSDDDDDDGDEHDKDAD